MKNSKYAEFLELEKKFNQAVELENGLNQEIGDKDDIIQLYKDSFDNGKGIIKAGNYLARLYQKIATPSSIKKANEIYKKITSIDQNDLLDPLPYVYAKYRLLRTDTRDIEKSQLKELNINDFIDEQSFLKARDNEEDIIINRIFKNIKEYNQIIEIYEVHAPNSAAHAKALYNKACLKLKIAEYAELFINREYQNYLKYAENDEEREELEKRLKIDISDIPELEDAIDLLTQAANMNYNEGTGYKKAKAELLNIKARNIYKDIDEVDNVLALCDKALALDPKNINAKLIKLNCYLDYAKEKEYKYNYYDKSQVLLREILKNDPTHPLAFKKNKELSEELIESISSRIITNLDNKTNDFSSIEYKKYFDINIPINIKFNFPGAIQSRKTEYFELLKAKIKKSLSEEKYFSQNAMFEQLNVNVDELTRDIWNANKNDIHKIFIDNNSRRKKDTIDSVTSIIHDFSSRNSKKLNSKTNDILTDRDKFKSKIISMLNNYHMRCAVLTSPYGTDLEVKVENTWLASIADATQLAASPLAAFLGNMQGGLIISAAVQGLKTSNDLIIKGRKEALLQAAKSFASIGEIDGQRKEGYSKRAENEFKYIANKLVEIYGMQIDNVHSTEIENLAIAATEKMLNHLNNETSIYKSLTNWAKSDNPLELAQNIFSYQDKKGDHYVSKLLDGIIEGKSRNNKDVDLKHKYEKTWKMDEIFEKPALTSNGRDIFVIAGSEPEKYGARYVTIIPDEYTEKILDESDADRIKAMYAKHKNELLLSSELNRQEVNEENAIRDIVIEQDKYASKKRKARQSYVWSIAKILMGVISAYSAGMIGFASYLGFHPVIATSAGALFGVSTAVIAPIAIAVFAASSAILIIKGVKDAITSHDKLENLEKNQIKVISKFTDKRRERTSEELEEIKFTEQKNRATIFAHKQLKNAKYVVPKILKNSLEKKEAKNSLDEVANVVLRQLGVSALENKINPTPRRNFQNLVNKSKSIVHTRKD